jgi:hypothetical protein
VGLAYIRFNSHTLKNKKMTVEQFNEKYKEYLEEGHYGLDISIPSVVKYLDEEVFPGLIKIPGFTYSQIKLKFNMPRFYTNLDEVTNRFVFSAITYSIEEDIKKLVTIYDEVKKELKKIKESGEEEKVV